MATALPSHRSSVRTSRAARARAARRRFPPQTGISEPFVVFGSASERSVRGPRDPLGKHPLEDSLNNPLEDPPEGPQFRASKPIDETLYSNLRNLANGKTDLILLHILAIGYNLARSGVARDASRRT